MSKHLNLSTIIDKNKISSENSFIILLAVEVKNPVDGTIVETIRFCKNSENIEYKGDLYIATNFDMDIKTEINKEPSITLKAHDETRALGQYIDLYDGLINNKVTMYIVNSAALQEAEMEEDFIILTASISGYKVEMALGIESAVNQRFPNFRQFKDRCAWKYKGIRCKYAGALPTCDYTRTGPNGCIAHDNEINFGGFPGINDLF